MFEKLPGKLFINNVNIQKNLLVTKQLKEAVEQSQLEFALEPYRDCLDLPEIDVYRNQEMVQTTQSSIIIKNWSLILVFGLKKLINDIQNNCIVPGFTWTNEEDYQVNEPKIKRMRMNDSNCREEYEYLKSKLISMNVPVCGLYKLNNRVIFLKYNAVRYFYYMNSFYRDQQQDNEHIIEGTDQNIIYKEQIVDDEDACYTTRYEGK